MYTYKYSAGRYKSYRPGYHVVDIKGYSVADLEKLFDILYIVVTDSMYNVDVSISLDDYKLEFASKPSLDIVGWLATQSGNNLKAAEIFPGDSYKYAKLERIFTYGYFHYPADLNLANDRQEDLLSDAAPDIRVAHYRYQNIDYANINDYSLFNINGVFLRSVARKDGIYLVGAGKDYITNKNDLRVGCINFEKLGKIKTIPITDDNLIETNMDNGKRWEMNISELPGKTVYLVVNGQLLVDPNIIHRVADDRVIIDLNSFSVSHHYLNYKKHTRTPKLTNLTKFDVYKRQALTMHNSFIVLVDNPSLGVETVPLTTFHYPNVLHTEEKFQHPLVLDSGLFPVPYIKTYGIGQRLLNHDLRFYNRYPFMTAGGLGGNILLNETVNQGNPGRLPKGWMFKIHGLQLRKT